MISATRWLSGDAASGAFPTGFGKNFFDEDRLGVCIGFPVGVMHDRKMPLEVIIALRFVGVGSEIVPEGQVQPLLSGWLSDVNMVRPASPVRRHPLNEEHSIGLRIVCPEDVAKPLQRFDDVSPRLRQAIAPR